VSFERRKLSPPEELRQEDVEDDSLDPLIATTTPPLLATIEELLQEETYASSSPDLATAFARSLSVFNLAHQRLFEELLKLELKPWLGVEADPKAITVNTPTDTLVTPPLSSSPLNAESPSSSPRSKGSSR
jgi:hypothetical protein